jgi:hypothetical protein
MFHNTCGRVCVSAGGVWALSPTAVKLLPESIAALASLHAVKLSGDDLEIEIDKLVQSIQRGRDRSHGGADGPDSIGVPQH